MYRRADSAPNRHHPARRLARKQSARYRSKPSPPSTAVASAVQVIVPAYPPPPTPWNRLVHAAGSGSQISILIAGSTTTETSQNAGRLGIGGDAWGCVGVG